MNYITHSVGGVAAGVAAVYVSTKIGIEVNAVALVAGGLVGGLLPDIDHPRSYLGKRILPISTLLYNVVGHRSLTHSLLFAVIAGIIVGIWSIAAGAGITLGILSHIFLDMFTRAGVAYLYPFKKHRIKWFNL